MDIKGQIKKPKYYIPLGLFLIFVLIGNILNYGPTTTDTHTEKKQILSPTSYNIISLLIIVFLVIASVVILVLLNTLGGPVRDLKK